MVKESYAGKKITIMGLGLHGGGLASARFFIKEGAEVTITDLRTEEILKPTLSQLKNNNITYTLGKHIESDFINADIVIKNPGVPRTSKYLKLAKRVETDISIFLSRTSCPIIAITGSKGKSSTVSAIYHVLKKHNKKTKLGGNITVSPLTFIEEVDNTTPVILELSSWQLADISGKNVLKPVISAVTNIMNDHQNAYNSMDEYAADKAVLFENLQGTGILNFNDNYRDFFEKRMSSHPIYYSKNLEPIEYNGAFIDQDRKGWIQCNKEKIQILDNNLTLKGEHQRENLLLAGLILYKFGVDTEFIKENLREFKGIDHRMELFKESNGVCFYNDSAATIPEAVCAAIESFDSPVRLISGGTDKELEFDCIRESFKKPVSIHLLKGTGTDKMIKVLDEENIKYLGPFSSLTDLVNDLSTTLKKGDSVLFSPGATSFGMFNNEFDRGNQFKDIISKI